MGEEGDVGDGAGGVGEDVDEGVADDFALGLGLVDAGELVHEGLGGVDEAELHVEVVGEEALDALGLVFAEEAVVDEDAGELLADGAVDEGCGDGAVDAAGEAEDDVGVADGLADGGGLGLDEGGHGPVSAAGADAAAEVGDEGGAVGGVDDLGVELDAEEGAVADLDGGELGVVGDGDGAGAFGGGEDFVAVAHPHDGGAGDVAEEGAGGVGDAELGAAVLAGDAGADLAAEGLHHELHAVADAEDGEAEVEEGGVDLGGAGLVDAAGAAGEDDAFGGERADAVEGGGEGEDLAVDLAFADAPGDELAVLRAEVEDDDLFLGLHGVIVYQRQNCCAAVVKQGERRTGRAASARQVERWEEVEGLPCGADTKSTKNHEGARRMKGCQREPPIPPIGAD